MVQITSMPELFSPALADIIYVVQTDSVHERFVAEMYEQQGRIKLGEKVLEGATEYKVNVAVYVRGMLAVAPLSRRDSSVSITEDERVAYLWFEGAADIIPYTGGKYICKPDGMLSDAPRTRETAAGEQDEISFISDSRALSTISATAVFKGDDGEEVGISLGGFNTGRQSYVTVVVNFDHLSRAMAQAGHSTDDYRGFSVHTGNGNVIDYRIVRRDPESVRVCWHNHYGGIDYFTFQHLKERKAVISKDGKCMYEETVTTPAMRTEDAQWLSQLLSAPKVWKVEGDRFIPVRVISDRMDVYGEGLYAIEVKLAFEV